jgi:hypothetical protein
MSMQKLYFKDNLTFFSKIVKLYLDSDLVVSGYPVSVRPVIIINAGSRSAQNECRRGKYRLSELLSRMKRQGTWW